jgi:lipopolysaccharide export system permease protein
MRILDKYILKRVITGYLFLLLVFIGFYLFIDISSNLSDFLKTKSSFFLLIDYYLNMLPLIFLTVSPYSLLISVLYTIGELNKNNEILSMRASGISILRLCLPILFFAILISSISFFLQEKILIASQKKIEDIKIQIANKDISHAQEEKNFAFSSKDMIFFVGKFLPKEKVLKEVIIFEEDEKNNLIRKIICKSIIYKNKKWVGKDVVEYHLDVKGDIIGAPFHWKEKDIDLEEKPEELVLKKSMFSYFSSLKNLKREIRRLRKIKAYNLLSNLIIEYHRKLISPFSHFFLVIGVLPFALEIKKRRLALSSLGMGFIFGFIYYSFGSFSVALGKAEIILPIFSAWLTPLFFLTLGITGLFLIR